MPEYIIKNIYYISNTNEDSLSPAHHHQIDTSGEKFIKCQNR